MRPNLDLSSPSWQDSLMEAGCRTHGVALNSRGGRSMLRKLVLTAFALLSFSLTSVHAQVAAGAPYYAPYTGSYYGVYQGRFYRTYNGPYYRGYLGYYRAPAPVYTYSAPAPMYVQPYSTPMYTQP